MRPAGPAGGGLRSARGPTDPTLFKRLLDEDDLTLLHTLGVIDRAHNGAYFHGHVDGKAGMRPTLDLWLTLHHVVDADKNEQEPWEHPGLRLLHYESFSGEDFVRKWTALLDGGPSVNFRPGREPTAVALRTLIGKGLTAEQARPYLMRIFERTTEDDLDHAARSRPARGGRPAGGHARPRGLRRRRRARSSTGCWTAATAVPKRAFHPGQPADEVARLLDDAGESVRGARRLLRRCPTTSPSATRQARQRVRWAASGHAASRRSAGTSPSASRSTASSRPRHCRSVPA